MKKLTTLIICATFLCSTALHAEDVQEDTLPTQVGKAAEEGSSSSRKWGQYAIAGVAIAVAVVALVLVAKHKGASTSSGSSSSH